MKTVPSARRAEEPPPASRPRVIVVEDDPSCRRLVREWLAPEFDLLILPDGETLMQDVLSMEPDAVVLDMGLPGKSGPELCKDLRRDARTAALPVVFLTANAGEEGFLNHLLSGSDAFIPKSASPSLLRRTLWSFLGDR